MSLSKSLCHLIPDDYDLDLMEFMKFRQDRDELSEDERDYEREEEEKHDAEKVVKRRKFMNRVYDGYNPVIALNSEWYLKYVKRTRLEMSKICADNFRRRFRMPFESFLSLVKEAREDDWFPDYEKYNAIGQKGAPLEILMLGSLRYLGRGWTFDDLFEATFVSQDVHRVFLHVFTKACRKHLYPKWVKRPETAEEIEDCMHEFKLAGFDGCIGSADVTHVTLERCHSKLKNQHLGSKSSHTTRAYQLVVNHRRQIIASTVGYPGRWNDKTIVRFDGFVTDIQRGLYLEDHKFTLKDSEGEDVNYEGAWILVDGGYLNWSSLICPFKDTMSIKDTRWSKWAESMRKDVECTFGILKGKTFIIISLHFIIYYLYTYLI